MKKTLAKSLRSAVALLLALVLAVGSTGAVFASEVPANAEDRITGKVQQLMDLLQEYAPKAVKEAGDYAIDHGYVVEVKEYLATLKAELLAFAAAYGVEKAEIKAALEGPTAQLEQLKDYVGLLQAGVALNKAGMTGTIDPENITREQLEDLKEAGLTGNIDPTTLTDDQIEALKEAGLSGEFNPDLFTEEEISQLESIQDKLNETQDKIESVETKVNTLKEKLQQVEDKVNELVEAAKAAEDLSESLLNILKKGSVAAVGIAHEKYIEAREKLFAALDNIYKPYSHLDELVANVLDLTTAICVETKELSLFVATDLKATAANYTKEDLVKAVGAMGLILGLSEETMTKIADKVKELMPPVIEKTKAVVAKVKEIAKAVVKAYINATTDDYCIDYASYYVAIGDAVAGMDDSYVDLLAEELGVKYDKSMTAFELLQDVVLDKEAIAKADIITLGFNATGMMSAATDSAVGNEIPWGDYDIPATAQKAIDEIMDEIQKYITAMGIPNAISKKICTVIESVAFNSMVYTWELPSTIAQIRAINKDAVVAVVGLDNPMENVVIKHNSVSLNVDKIFDAILATSDLYSLGYAMLTGNCIFVAAPAAENPLEKDTVEITDIASVILGDFESLIPNANGQKYIQTQIYNALNITHGYKWGDANLDGVVDYIDAMIVLQYHCKLPVAGGKIFLPVCNVDGVDKVDYVDAMMVLQKHCKLRDVFPVEK